MEWRSIETAPTDREILVYNEMTGVYKTKHAMEWPTGWGKSKSLGVDGAWPMLGWNGMEGVWFPEPSHWQELPPPPRTPHDPIP